MKQNVHPLHTSVPDLVEPFRGWHLICAWLAAACIVVFIIIGALTVGNRVADMFVTLVAPTVTVPTLNCER